MLNFSYENKLIILGAVHTIKKLQNNKLVAGINSTVIVYNFISNELQIDCRHHNNILVLTVDVDAHGFIFVGDIFRSTALLQYNSSDSSLKEIARDYRVDSGITQLG